MRFSFVRWTPFVLLFLLSAGCPQGKRAVAFSNEASAIASLRTLSTAEAQYKQSDGKGVYGSLPALQTAVPPFIDSVLSSGHKSGYSFVGATDAGRSFTFHAVPLIQGKTGNRRYFVDQTGRIRFNPNGDATSGSTPIE